jgi:hypothetical protein
LTCIRNFNIILQENDPVVIDSSCCKICPCDK